MSEDAKLGKVFHFIIQMTKLRKLSFPICRRTLKNIVYLLIIIVHPLFDNYQKE